jgi:hypothetical protein
VNTSLNSDERRHVRTSLIACVAFVSTFLLGGFAWAGTTAPAPGRVGSRAAAALAGASAGAWTAPEEEQNTMVGCGCAEACLAAD